MTATTTDERSFLSRIAANPADDTDRLVYADWLDEHAADEHCPNCAGSRFSGRVPQDHMVRNAAWLTCPRCMGTSKVSDGRRERAEFIRDGVEAARCGMEHYQPLDPQATDWRRAGDCPECWGSGTQVSGQPGPACPRCWGSGDVGGLLRAVSAEWNGGGRFDTAVPLRVDFERGFPHRVHCRLEDVVDAAGVPTSWARAVVKCHPVTRFVVSDRRPELWVGQGRESYSWFLPDFLNDPATLPESVYDALVGWDFIGDGRKAWRTAVAANDALHTALARLAAGS